MATFNTRESEVKLSDGSKTLQSSKRLSSLPFSQTGLKACYGEQWYLLTVVVEESQRLVI